MEDKAVQAVRAKRDSSMHVGLRLVREGQAAGFVTAGNTGAAMASAKMVLGALQGVDRPALAAVFPTAPGTAAILLDVGANVDCKPHNLEQFAVMGEIYFRAMFGELQARPVRLRRRQIAARWTSFHWRRRNQRERTDARVVPVIEAPAFELCGQCGGTRPVQWPRRRDRRRRVRGQRRA